MSRERRTALISLTILAALVWPALSPADHTRTNATVSARLKEQRSTDTWTVELRWEATCLNVASGKEVVFDGNLYLVNEVTEERIYAGAVVATTRGRSTAGSREWPVSARPRSQRLRPELTVHCYESFPQDGGPDVTVNGAAVVIPPQFSDGGGGGGGGSGGGGEDGGGAGEPLGGIGCRTALIGTNRRDLLDGGGSGEIIVGFGAGDRLRGRDGNDCLIGGGGGDRLLGGAGSDRLTGGKGRDVLIDREGGNGFNAGSGADYVNARNGHRELVRCGSGHDLARVDRRDRLRGCERVSRRG